MVVPAEDYESAMNPEANFKLTATCRVQKTKQMFATSEAFFLKKPQLTFEV